MAAAALPGNDVLAHYLPILIFIIVALVFGAVALWPRRADDEKLSPYECGFEPFEDARMKFDVRYYLVAILFII